MQLELTSAKLISLSPITCDRHSRPLQILNGLARMPRPIRRDSLGIVMEWPGTSLL
ncbi:hypothetical protein [Nostoc sp.]|uniref:hypothetical protein n=1 Tax=Nostoc sp. TaxID=1180 RepID=UPI002FF763E4